MRNNKGEVMSRKREKRSSEQGTASRCPLTQDMFGGVGGRQASPKHSHGGGGYQNICTVLNFDPAAAEKKRDPRLDELREMGLQRVWLDVAEAIGVDALLKMWRILDADPASIGNAGRLLIPLRSYSTFLRYQRNRYIESLDALGHKPPEIQKKLKDQLCEHISIRHISRLVQPE